MTKDYRNIHANCSTYKNFKFNYPKIELSVDLKKEDEIINLYYNQISSRLFVLIINGGMRTGEVNYNTDTGLVEVKEAKFKNLHSINKTLFVDCEGEGLLIKEANFHRCDIKNSILEECQFMSYCNVSNSKLHNCLSEKPAEFKNCFIDVQYDKMIYFGIFEDCIFKNVMPGNNSEFIGDNNVSVKEKVKEQQDKKGRFIELKRERKLISMGLQAPWGNTTFKEIPPEYPNDTYADSNVDDDDDAKLKPKIKIQ